jgi:hypothetical protein
VAADLLREAEELRRCLAALDDRVVADTDPASRERTLAGLDDERIGEALARGHRMVAELTALLGHLHRIRESKERLDRARGPRTP